MVPITNGVHRPTWDRIGEADLAAPGSLWRRHQELKAELLAQLKAETGRDWPANTLLIGWARRIVSYKRPLAIFADLERLQALARDASRPVRFVFAGHPHPRDVDGAEILHQLRQTIDDKCSDFAVYWPEYSIAHAKPLVAGCDLWLNTPVVGFEACGTSGMKAALNGVLPCTTNDGWVHEVDLQATGWYLDDARVGANFLDLLDEAIRPCYYERDAAGLPLQWERRMRAARQLILDGFTASRMLREYVEMLYL
jgi:starch phosphorylase